MSTKLSSSHIVACFIACFGSSLLYGYSMAVFNGPKTHIQCFLGETMLGITHCSGSRHAGSRKNASSSETNASDNDTLAYPAYSGLNATRLTIAESHKIGFYYSLLSTVWLAFGAVGAFSSGPISSFFGRRNGLLFNNAFAIAGAAIGAPAVAARVPALLYLGRAFIGLNCGVTIGLVGIYLAEIAPTNVRGALAACHQVAVTIGILIAFVISGFESLLNQPHLWIVAHALTGLPALVSLAVLPFCPESPRYLFIDRGDLAAAKKALGRLYPGEDPQPYIDEMKIEANPLKSADEEKRGAEFKFWQLFTLPELRMPVALSSSVQVMQQLCGINAVVAFSSAVMETCGIQKSYVPFVNLGISVFDIVCTIISLPLLERLGRRKLLLWPTVVLAGSLIVLCISAVYVREAESDSVRHAASVVFIVFIFIYISSFAFGLGPIPGFFVAELFRQETRSSAYSLSQGLKWICNLVLSTTFVNLQLALKGYVFLVYLCFVVPLWFFFYFCMPETQGRSFDAIARKLATQGRCCSSESNPEDAGVERVEFIAPSSACCKPALDAKPVDEDEGDATAEPLNASEAV